MFHGKMFQFEWTHNVKYCLDTLHISIKLSFLFTCCKVKTLGYNNINCSKGSFKQWQNTTIVKTSVFIEQLVNKHFCGNKLCKILYFIKVHVKTLHRTVMKQLNNSTVDSTYCFVFYEGMFSPFNFWWHKFYKPHYKPSLPDRAETYLHWGADVILTCFLLVF